MQLPALTTGYVLDDHIQRERIRAALDHTRPPLEAYPPTLWDVFVFVPADASSRQELIDHGVLSWATDPGLSFQFFRPLSALTHLADNIVSDTPEWAHLHSTIWLGLLFVVLLAHYRRIQGSPFLVGLALFIYALDDARSPTAAWIANRNALIAAVFGVLALVAHDRARREGWRWGHALGPLAYAAALLAGESGIATLGYLAAHALVLDRGPLRSRAAALVPYAVVTLAWAALYGALGYGVRHSGAYVDPVDDPVRFASALATNVPVLVATQLSGVWADLLVLIDSSWFRWFVMGSCLYLLLFADAVRTVVLRSREARYWALGALLAAVPAASAVPTDRLATFVMIGLAGLVACFIESGWRDAAAATAPLRRATLQIWTVGLIAVHVVGAPLFISLRALANGSVGAWVERGESSLPHVAAGTTPVPIVIAVNPPSEAMLSYTPMMRAARNEDGPGLLRALATGRSAVTLTRESPTTLRVRPATPYLGSAIERLVRSAPFAIGDRVALTGVTVEVTAVTDDARPAETLWRFERPLEDPRHVWLAWSDERIGFVPFTPPALGETVTQPAVDMVRAFLGH